MSAVRRQLWEAIDAGNSWLMQNFFFVPAQVARSSAEINFLPLFKHTVVGDTCRLRRFADEASRWHRMADHLLSTIIGESRTRRNI